MQVLRVAQKAYPDVTGGGAYHVHALSRDQAAAGHDVTLLTVGQGDRHERRAGYEVERHPVRMAPLGNGIAPGVWRTLRSRSGADVVHAHSHLYASTNMAALDRALGGTPLAITNHGLYSQTAPRWLFEVYLRTGGRLTLNSADVVFCYTEVERDRLRELGVRTTVEVVHNGIDTERFHPPDDAATARDGPVLFVGRLVDGKNPATAVRAFANVATVHPDRELLIAGEGPLRNSLLSLATDLGIRERVRLLGHIAYDRMPSLYRRASVMVLPSRSEGVPRTVLEALASGVPVVASDLAQLSPLLDAGGVAVPPGHADAVAAALSDLLEDPGRRAALGAAGREYVRANHAWAETVEETTDALAALAER
jgi:glycogen(starch) synthase